jgi:hypothetical protein
MAIQQRWRRGYLRFGFVLSINGKRRSFFRAKSQGEAEKELAKWCSPAVHVVNG